MGYLHDDKVHFNMISISCMVGWLLQISHFSMYPFGPFYPLLPGSQCLDKRVPFSGPLPLPWDSLNHVLPPPPARAAECDYEGGGHCAVCAPLDCAVCAPLVVDKGVILTRNPSKITPTDHTSHQNCGLTTDFWPYIQYFLE